MITESKTNVFFYQMWIWYRKSLEIWKPALLMNASELYSSQKSLVVFYQRRVSMPNSRRKTRIPLRWAQRISRCFGSPRRWNGAYRKSNLLYSPLNYHDLQAVCKSSGKYIVYTYLPLWATHLCSSVLITIKNTSIFSKSLSLFLFCIV